MVDDNWLAKFLAICCTEIFSSDDSPSELNKYARDAIEILKERYVNGYRHQYSKIARVLRARQTDYTSDQFDLLSDNLLYIEDHIDQFELNDLQKRSIAKLFDHLRLEVDRLVNVDRKIMLFELRVQEFQKQLKTFDKDAPNKLQSNLEIVVAKANGIETQVKDYKSELKKVSDKESELQQKLDGISGKLEGFNTQSITVLSIFTAIVFAFTGGFTMLGNAFSNITGINRNEALLLIALVLLVGCVLADIIYFLMMKIEHISSGYTKGTKQKQISNKISNKCIAISANIIVGIIVLILLGVSLFWVTPEFPK